MNYDTQLCAVDQLQTVFRVLTSEDTNSTGESKMEAAVILAVTHNLQLVCITNLQALPEKRKFNL